MAQHLGREIGGLMLGELGQMVDGMGPVAIRVALKRFGHGLNGGRALQRTTAKAKTQLLKSTN